MFGFAVSAACVAGLIAIGIHHHRHGCSADCACGDGHRHDVFGRHRMMWWVLKKLETSPAQEKVIRSALGELRKKGLDSVRSVKDTRQGVASAIRGETLDDGSLGGVFQKHDEALEGFRRAALDALRRVHETLDERQRQTLADLVERGPCCGLHHRHFGHCV